MDLICNYDSANKPLTGSTDRLVFHSPGCGQEFAAAMNNRRKLDLLRRSVLDAPPIFSFQLPSTIFTCTIAMSASVPQ